MGPMRKRLLGLLMVLTIMMGTIVAASGILAEPVPTPLTSAPAEGAERPTEAAPARGTGRADVGEESSDGEESQRSEVTRAPRAAEQDQIGRASCRVRAWISWIADSSETTTESIG